MNNATLILAGLTLLSYLLGAIPSGLLIGLARGVDVRKAGSGNIGATNVFRTVGKKWGGLALFCDALKGLVPAAAFPALAARLTGEPGGQGLAVLFGCAAVAGHNWPVYLRFKGGKGIATSAGVLIGIAPAPLGIGAATWLLVFMVTRYVSVASITAAVVIPAAAWVLLRAGGLLVPVFLTLLGAMAIVRHRSNIQRLIRGQENRIQLGRRPKGEAV